MTPYSKNILSSFMLGILFLILFSFTSCLEDDNSVNNNIVETKVVKEILIRGLQLLDYGKIATIQSQEELNQLFDNKNFKIPVELENIDFEKHTVILVTKTIGRGLDTLLHTSFKHKENKTYEYTIKIIYNELHEAPTFTFGVIVEKIPIGSNILLTVTDNSEL
ncbi:MAG: hypothetical protein ACOX09_06125 [Candidatus Kapaibacterium sp.]|jgi:hypothetical protein